MANVPRLAPSLTTTSALNTKLLAGWNVHFPPPSVCLALTAGALTVPPRTKIPLAYSEFALDTRFDADTLAKPFGRLSVHPTGTTNCPKSPKTIPSNVHSAACGIDVMRFTSEIVELYEKICDGFPRRISVPLGCPGFLTTIVPTPQCPAMPVSAHAFMLSRGSALSAPVSSIAMRPPEAALLSPLTIADAWIVPVPESDAAFR